MKKYIFMCLATLLCLEACKENERQLFALNEDFLNIWFGVQLLLPSFDA